MISPAWIQILFDAAVLPPRSVSHVVLSAHFQLLNSLCQLSQTTIADVVSNIKSTHLISNILLDTDDLLNRTQSLLRQVQAQESSSFERDLTTVRDITLGNQFMSAFETGWDLITDTNETQPIFTVPRIYGKVLYMMHLLSLVAGFVKTRQSRSKELLPFRLFGHRSFAREGCPTLRTISF